MILEGYILFALTTSIMATFKLLPQVMGRLRTEHPEHNLVTYYKVAYLTFFTLSTLIAPLILLAVMLPKPEQAFVNAMYEAIEKD